MIGKGTIEKSSRLTGWQKTKRKGMLGGARESGNERVCGGMKNERGKREIGKKFW